MSASLSTTFDESEPIYTIGVAAKKLGVSVPTLRMYEMAGLILPFRTPTGRRIYSHEEIKRIECLRSMLKEDGLNLASIRRLIALLPCWELKPCREEMRNNCEAYVEDTKPCWELDSRPGVHDKDECRHCQVYRKSLECSREMKALFKKISYGAAS